MRLRSFERIIPVREKALYLGSVSSCVALFRKFTRRIYLFFPTEQILHSCIAPLRCLVSSILLSLLLQVLIMPTSSLRAQSARARCVFTVSVCSRDEATCDLHYGISVEIHVHVSLVLKAATHRWDTLSHMLLCIILPFKDAGTWSESATHTITRIPLLFI